MPCDDIVAGGPNSPLAAPIEIDGMRIGNRFAINPMEGWDGEHRRLAERQHRPPLAAFRPAAAPS